VHGDHGEIGTEPDDRLAAMDRRPRRGLLEDARFDLDDPTRPTTPSAIVAAPAGAATSFRLTTRCAGSADPSGVLIRMWTCSNVVAPAGALIERTAPPGPVSALNSSGGGAAARAAPANAHPVRSIASRAQGLHRLWLDRLWLDRLWLESIAISSRGRLKRC